MEDTNIRQNIINHLKSDKRSMRWLAGKIGISHNTLFYTLSHPNSKFPKERIAKINEVLKTKFKD